MTLVEMIRAILVSIAKDPHHYPPPASTAIEEVASCIKEQVLRVLSKTQRRDHKVAVILEDLLSLEFTYRAAIAYYFLKYDLKFAEDKALKLIAATIAIELDIGTEEPKELIELEILELIRKVLYREMLPPARTGS